MKNHFTLFVFLCLVSCSSAKLQIEELYGKCSVPIYECNQLLLNPNKTFEYYLFEDIGGENIIKGNWDIHNGDTLKLNSLEQPEKDDLFNKLHFTNTLIVRKNNKIVFLKTPELRQYILKKNELSNKMW